MNKNYKIMRFKPFGISQSPALTEILSDMFYYHPVCCAWRHVIVFPISPHYAIEVHLVYG